MSVTAVLRQERQPAPHFGGWLTVVLWDGYEVEVEGDRPCDLAHCLLGVMHHYGDSDDGSGRLLHYCPTGFLFCGWCCGIADEPGLARCTRWEG